MDVSGEVLARAEARRRVRAYMRELLTIERERAEVAATNKDATRLCAARARIGILVRQDLLDGREPEELRALGKEAQRKAAERSAEYREAGRAVPLKLYAAEVQGKLLITLATTWKTTLTKRLAVAAALEALEASPDTVKLTVG